MTAKLKYNEVEYNLNYSLESPDYSYPTIEDFNPINGERFFITVNYYDTFKIRTWLFKYNDPTAKLIEINSLLGKRVLFKPNLKSDYIRSTTNDAYVNFYIVSVEPYTLSNKNDYLILRLISEQYINQNAPLIYYDENDNYYSIEDGDGGFIHEEDEEE
jgi:hypothetical protein